MPKTVIEVPDPSMKERHDIKVRQAEVLINDYVEKFEKKKGNRPQPSGRFPSRQISEPTLRYLAYLQEVHIANNDLLSEVINALSDKLALVDTSAIDARLQRQARALQDARDDIEVAYKEATEAKELAVDANARIDEIDETLDEYFE